MRCEPGAPYAWLELPERWNVSRFTAALGAVNIKVTPGSAFLLVPNLTPRHIRICFGTSTENFKVRKAFESIRALMNEQDEDEFTPVA